MELRLTQIIKSGKSYQTQQLSNFINTAPLSKAQPLFNLTFYIQLFRLEKNSSLQNLWNYRSIISCLNEGSFQCFWWLKYSHDLAVSQCLLPILAKFLGQHSKQAFLFIHLKRGSIFFDRSTFMSAFLLSNQFQCFLWNKPLPSFSHKQKLPKAIFVNTGIT